MNVTTRDLFNFVNPTRTYARFLKEQGLCDGDLPEVVEYTCQDTLHRGRITRGEVLEAKQQGTIAGEQVQHTRFQDEVDVG
jgi:hypothetical protein